VGFRSDWQGVTPHVFRRRCRDVGRGKEARKRKNKKRGAKVSEGLSKGLKEAEEGARPPRGTETLGLLKGGISWAYET